MYYYSASIQRYFKNEEDIFRYIICMHDFHKNGFYKCGTKEEEPLDIMGHKYNRKIFYVTGKHRRHFNETDRGRMTVREVENIPEGTEPFSAETFLRYHAYRTELTSKKEREKWAKELEHFQKFPTVEDLKNNLYKEEK